MNPIRDQNAYWTGVMRQAGIRWQVLAPKYPDVHRLESLEELFWFNKRSEGKHIFELSDLTIADVNKIFHDDEEGMDLNFTLNDRQREAYAYVQVGQTLDEQTFHSARQLTVGRKGLKILGVFGKENSVGYIPRYVIAGIAIGGKKVVARPDEFQIIYIFPEEARQRSASQATLRDLRLLGEK